MQEKRRRDVWIAATVLLVILCIIFWLYISADAFSAHKTATRVQTAVDYASDSGTAGLALADATKFTTTEPVPAAVNTAQTELTSRGDAAPSNGHEVSASLDTPTPVVSAPVASPVVAPVRVVPAVPPTSSIVIPQGGGGGGESTPVSTGVVDPGYGGGGGAGGGSGGDNPSDTPPADTTPPDITFTITECGSSLFADSCTLFGTSTVHLVLHSTSADFLLFEITDGLTVSTTTSTATTTEISANESRTVSVRGKDTAGNWSAAVAHTVTTITTPPVVVNEVYWGGVPWLDQYIELYNTSTSTIQLADWVLYTPDSDKLYIPLVGSIAPGGFFTVAPSEVIRGTTVNQVFLFADDPIRGLDTFTRQISLAIVRGDATTTVDLTPPTNPECALNWCSRSEEHTSELQSQR